MKTITGKFLLLLILAWSITLTSCVTVPRNVSNSVGTNDSSEVFDESDRIQAVIWFRFAAESRALYYQAYNIAKDRLDDAIYHSRPKDKLAVIMDIDETILDNGPFQTCLINHNREYSTDLWKQWEDQSAAQALPGAQQFLAYAASRGVDIYYISNRGTNDLLATERNLQAQNFPMVCPEHLLLQSGHEGKEPNRESVETNHTVVLLMGDQLTDFSTNFDVLSYTNSMQVTETNQERFGRQYIVLPNPMYGDWEDALYPSKKLTKEEKTAFKKAFLLSHEGIIQ